MKAVGSCAVGATAVTELEVPVESRNLVHAGKAMALHVH
jgi:hypothetical protein